MLVDEARETGAEEDRMVRNGIFAYRHRYSGGGLCETHINIIMTMHDGYETIYCEPYQRQTNHEDEFHEVFCISSLFSTDEKCCNVQGRFRHNTPIPIPVPAISTVKKHTIQVPAPSDTHQLTKPNYTLSNPGRPYDFNGF